MAWSPSKGNASINGRQVRNSRSHSSLQVFKTAVHNRFRSSLIQYHDLFSSPHPLPPFSPPQTHLFPNSLFPFLRDTSVYVSSSFFLTSHNFEVALYFVPQPCCFPVSSFVSFCSIVSWYILSSRSSMSVNSGLEEFFGRIDSAKTMDHSLRVKKRKVKMVEGKALSLSEKLMPGMIYLKRLWQQKK